jgi:hypothetical protein
MVWPVSLTVVQARLCTFHMGSGAIYSQVTEITDDAGRRGWEREWSKLPSLDRSTERLGRRREGWAEVYEVLELAAEPAHWDALAELVADVDTLDRPVVKCARGTTESAPRWLAKGGDAPWSEYVAARSPKAKSSHTGGRVDE